MCGDVRRLVFRVYLQEKGRVAALAAAQIPLFRVRFSGGWGKQTKLDILRHMSGFSY